MSRPWERGGRPIRADVEQALAQGHSLVVWKRPDGTVETLAAREPGEDEQVVWVKIFMKDPPSDAWARARERAGWTPRPLPDCSD